jgi:hypothetical protein
MLEVGGMLRLRVIALLELLEFVELRGLDPAELEVRGSLLPSPKAFRLLKNFFGEQAVQAGRLRSLHSRSKAIILIVQ